MTSFWLHCTDAIIRGQNVYFAYLYDSISLVRAIKWDECRSDGAKILMDILVYYMSLHTTFGFTGIYLKNAVYRYSRDHEVGHFY